MAVALVGAEVINGGFGMVLDGSKDAKRHQSTCLFWDAINGISRRSWARDDGAVFAIKREMESEPNLKMTHCSNLVPIDLMNFI